MNNSVQLIAVVRNIKVKCTFDNPQKLDNSAIESAVLTVKKSGLAGAVDIKHPYVYKKSIDARNRDDILLIYSVAFPVSDVGIKSVKNVDIISTGVGDDIFTTTRNDVHRPVVVGFGPGGMFCALALAKAGLRPIVLERGDDVDRRTQAVTKYWQEGVLDPHTNVQFGEGGAGTFSDGKLLTRINDKLCHYVLSEFVNCGAPDEILYLAKPHIGTDNLRTVVKNIRNKIIELGGEVRFNSCLKSIRMASDNSITAAVLENGDEVACSSLFLCIGHSSRDTVLNLMKQDISVEPKAFSVGVRIEHLQSDIDKALYGKFVGAPSLGTAQYTLSRKFGDRAVYSFCMCPGGVVVASASDEGQIVTNGMSYYARDGKNANSAIAVSVNTSDYGNTVEGAINFQHSIEKKAYNEAGGDGTAPIQCLGDFLAGVVRNEPSAVMPTYTGKTVVRNADSVFPQFITDNLRRGISMFERDIDGFANPAAVLTFPETRTSSPVRIPRNEDFLAVGYKNLYPCGEGAGYAGGITSAAVDGLRVALAFLENRG